MDVRYDRANDLFWYGGKQLYWSSIYVLRQRKATLSALMRRLKVSKEEERMFREELDDLRSLGLIKGSSAISVTDKGREFLYTVEHQMRFRHLREKGVHDIDEAMDEAKKLYTIDMAKTKSLIHSLPYHHERVDWFPLFINSVVGLFVFLFIVLAMFYGFGELSADEFIVQAVLSPVTSVMAIGSATTAFWVLYHGGRAIDSLFFRRK